MRSRRSKPYGRWLTRYTTLKTSSTTASTATAEADHRARSESHNDRTCLCTRRGYPAPGSAEAVGPEQRLEVALERGGRVDVVRPQAQQRHPRAVAELHVHLGLARVVDQDLLEPV